MRTITFIFPHPVAGPIGGYKVVYEYLGVRLNTARPILLFSDPFFKEKI